jgi:hypothetical protein
MENGAGARVFSDGGLSYPIREIREIRGQGFFGCTASPRYAFCAFLRPIPFGCGSAPPGLSVASATALRAPYRETFASTIRCCPASRGCPASGTGYLTPFDWLRSSLRFIFHPHFGVEEREDGGALLLKICDGLC